MSDTAAGLLQVGLLLVLLAAVYRPLGGYMARVYTSEKHSPGRARCLQAVRGRREGRPDLGGLRPLGDRVLRRERDPAVPVPAAAARPAAVQRSARTSSRDWRSTPPRPSSRTPTGSPTSPEVTMGHLVQFAGLAVQNFLSAAVGIAVAIALIRGFARTKTDRLGNFWVDLTRTVLRVLLPIAILGGLVLVAMGVVQNFSGGHEVTSVVGQTQTLPGGPVASQEVIKELGTNGGGFYNANSAHPFENPNPLSEPVRDLPAAGDPGLPDPHLRPDGQGQAAGLRDPRRDGARSGRPSSLLATIFEVQGAGTATQAAGAAMEGKETRFGEWASALFAVSTTGTSTGAVNSAHDSFTPLGGGVALFHMMLGEVTPGGTGTGLYGMLVLAVLTVFVAGPDGRPDAGVPEEEDHRARDEAGLAVHPDDADGRPGRCLARDGPGDGAGLDLQHRQPARLLRGAVRVHLGRQQQRQRVRRYQREHPVLQHRSRARDAARPVRADRARAGPGRLARPAAAGPGDPGHAAHPQGRCS